ncbi:MAG: hypothetical protein H8D67_30965 [Deltaproteobacteria bacterium]|nr:hypothetical protein [Deltaproteobacteria bacterium]
MNPKTKLMTIVNNAKGNNLERVQWSFAGFSSEEMQQQYGASGQTCQEILEGYHQERVEWEAAKKLLIDLLDSVI